MIGAASDLGGVGSLIFLDKLVWAPGDPVGGYCETSSLEMTLAMDARTSTGVRVVRILVGKVYNLCRVKSIRIAVSTVKGRRYGLVTMIMGSEFLDERVR